MHNRLLFIIVNVAWGVVAAMPTVAWAEQPKQSNMASRELLVALQMEEFEGLSKKLLVDKRALVCQLQTIIDEPTGESDAEKSFIRRRAIIALGMYGGSRAVRKLRLLVEDEDESFRRDALIALGRTRTGAGVAIATEFIKHEDELFREAAIDALAASGRQDALQALKNFDDSKDRAFIQRKRREAINRLTKFERHSQKQ